MSMKKVLITLISLFFLCGCTNTCKENVNTNSENYSKDQIGLISSVQESNSSLPDFKINIYGNYSDKLNKDKLSNIKVNDFEAIFSSKENSYKRTFTGIKVKDVIDYLKIEKGSSITFEGYDAKISTFKLADIDDTCYFIFKVYGDDIYVNDNNNVLTFAKFNSDSSNWIYGVNVITIDY